MNFVLKFEKGFSLYLKCLNCFVCSRSYYPSSYGKSLSLDKTGKLICLQQNCNVGNAAEINAYIRQWNTIEIKIEITIQQYFLHKRPTTKQHNTH